LFLGKPFLYGPYPVAKLSSKAGSVTGHFVVTVCTPGDAGNNLSNQHVIKRERQHLADEYPTGTSRFRLAGRNLTGIKYLYLVKLEPKSNFDKK
jgi:hypothetical protein